jgi:hypothetical protein
MKARARPILKLIHALMFAAAILASLPAAAQAPAPGAELDQKLAKYDPAAVTAAKHYAEVFNMKTVPAQSMPAVRDAIIRIVKQKNPEQDDATLKEFVEAALKVMYVDQAGFYEKFTIVTMLDVYTTEEIIVIDQFYSSDVGRSMLKKAPQVIARMPQMFEIMQKQMFPLALEEARKAMKAKGKDIRI